MGKLTPELEQDRDIITNRKPALLSPASPSVENGISCKLLLFQVPAVERNIYADWNLTDY